MILKHTYKNTYTEELVDNNGNVLSYKQWVNNELIIHREWEYDSNNRSILFVDIFEKYKRITSYHKVKEIEITNQWDKEGMAWRFYIKNNGKNKYVIKSNNSDWRYINI